MKNLILLALFMVQPVVSMDLWSKIQDLIITNPSPKQAPRVEKPLPVLPTDIQTSELIKQLLEVSTTRDQALSLLSNYVRVNKTIAQYVKTNKNEIQKLLDKKFGLSLTALASGDYTNPSIKSEALYLLERSPLTDAIAHAIKNPQAAIANATIVEATDELRLMIKNKQFNVVAAILGALNNFYSTNRLVFDVTNGFTLWDEFKKYMNDFGQDKEKTVILGLLMQTIIKIFGTSFVNNTKRPAHAYSTDQRTLLEWARASRNKQVIEYLERIKKLG